jgi:hypothetical protein
MREARRFGAVEHRHGRFRGISRGRGGRSGAVAGFLRVRGRGFFCGPDDGAHGRGAWVFTRGRSSKHRRGNQHHRNHSQGGDDDQDGGAPGRAALNGSARAVLGRARASLSVGRRGSRARRGGDGSRGGASRIGAPAIAWAWRGRKTARRHGGRGRSRCAWRSARGGCRGRRRAGGRGWCGRRWTVGRRNGRGALGGCRCGRAERGRGRSHGRRDPRLRPRRGENRRHRGLTGERLTSGRHRGLAGNSRTGGRHRRLTGYGRLTGRSGRARKRSAGRRRLSLRRSLAWNGRPGGWRGYAGRAWCGGCLGRARSARGRHRLCAGHGGSGGCEGLRRRRRGRDGLADGRGNHACGRTGAGGSRRRACVDRLGSRHRLGLHAAGLLYARGGGGAHALLHLGGALGRTTGPLAQAPDLARLGEHEQ